MCTPGHAASLEYVRKQLDGSAFPRPPWSRVEGKSRVILPQMPPLRDGICMELDQRNHPFAPGLPPGRGLARVCPQTARRVSIPTPDPTRGNRTSQFPEFNGESTPKVDSTYLGGSSLEPFLFTIFTRKIQGGSLPKRTDAALGVETVVDTALGVESEFCLPLSLFVPTTLASPDSLTLQS